MIAALDARHGEVVVEGWQKGTGRGVLERIAELRDLVGGFLVTFVEREGGCRAPIWPSPRRSGRRPATSR